MHTVSADEAKTRLLGLLKREPVGKIIDDLREFRAGRRLGDLSVREMIEQGR